MFLKSHKPHKHWKICTVTVKIEPLRFHFESYKWQTWGVNVCLALESCCRICYIIDRKRESHRSGYPQQQKT